MEKFKKNLSKIALFIGVLLFFVFPIFSNAEDLPRSYKYNSIDAQFTVNTDSTVDVVEKQTYQFTGEYHEGWRSISTKGTSYIDEIGVYDEEGNWLQFVPEELNKLDPSSWGKYTIKNRPGYVDVIWYYNAKDESQSWTIAYKLHGAIAFLKEIDELYWNVATEYTVPIDVVTASITIPKNDFPLDLFQASVYEENVEESKKEIVDNSYVFFSAYNVSPQGKFTIAFGWPKGIVKQSAFWKDWFSQFKGLLVPLYIIFGSIFLTFLYWYFSERFMKYKDVVVAEYEPPLNLRPAMMDVILNEEISKKTWPATVVDLAVRGFIKIDQEGHNSNVTKMVIYISVVAILCSFVFFSFDFIVALTVFLFIFLMFAQYYDKRSVDYKISKIKDFEGDSDLEDYEKKFLDILFAHGDTFSTSEVALSQTKSRYVYKRMRNLEKFLYREIEKDYPNFYASSIKKQSIRRNVKISNTIFSPFFIVPIFILMSVNSEVAFVDNFTTAVYFLAFVLPIYLLVIFVIFNPRLSKEGAETRRKIKGFELYIKTAEQLRLQNLKPEFFEKYLPYAITLGLEKKWAKNFDGMNLKNPSWYGSSSGLHYSSSGGTSGVLGFSAVAFSTSFATSFSSAFASSGASGGAGGGGGSGGGGGAGGGGGGGGGGAS